MPLSNSSFHGINLLQRGIKLQHLRLIAQLRKTAQISAAAEAMNISQPAASRLAGEIEHISDIKLYNRHPRGIELTEAGLRFATRAQSILEGLLIAGREIAELSNGTAGSVSIGSVTGPAIEFILPVLKQMRESHPLVEISVTVDISEVIAQDLLSNRIDFYIGRFPVHDDPRQFQASVIGEEPIDLVVRQDHPLTKKTDLNLTDCLSYDWVMQSNEGLINKTVDDYLMKQGLHLPNKILSTSSLLLSLATILETSAIVPISRAVADFFGSGNNLNGRIVSLPVARDLSVSSCSLIKMEETVLSPAAQVFYDLLLQQYPPPLNNT